MEKLKRWVTAHTTWIIIVVVLLGFSSIAAVNYFNYTGMIASDAKNITRLTAAQIYSEIDGMLSQPLTVALTMAHNSFLRKWLTLEEDDTGIEHGLRADELKQYLQQMEVCYGYNSVALISDKTKRYYHQSGIRKILSPDDEHDQWYYKFLQTGYSYEIVVDHDENDKNELTLFINARIIDDDCRVLGVVGIGVKLGHVVQMLRKSEDTFGLRAYLVDNNGLVQAHTNESLILRANLLKRHDIAPLGREVLDTSSEGRLFYQSDGPKYHCLISRYIALLGWNLIVEKEISPLVLSISSQLLPNLMILLVIIGSLLAMVSLMVLGHDKTMRSLAQTDPLTGLSNRSAAESIIERWLADKNARDCSAFLMLDIDNFKSINDRMGHAVGDEYLKGLAQCLKGQFRSDDVVARLGGDEFCVFMRKVTGKAAVRQKAEQLVALVRRSFTRNDVSSLMSVSVGIAMCPNDGTSFSDLYRRADTALYQVKNSSKNNFCFYDDLPHCS